MGYKLVINGVYLGYDPLTNLLLNSWGILLGVSFFNMEAVHQKPPAKTDFGPFDVTKSCQLLP